jgi:DNA-binding response OmpR family regulator
MPQMNGFELSREIRKKDANLKICFMSAFEINPPEARKTIPHLASYCFIKKPIGIAELASHIRAHFVQG